MPAMWPKFQADYIKVLSEQKIKSEEDFANSLVDSYKDAVKTAATIFQAMPVAGTFKDKIMRDAFVEAFKMMKDGDTSIAPYTLMATGIVGFWAGVQFQTMPPFPPSVGPAPVPTPNIVVFPGVPLGLDSQLQTAFNMGKKALSATDAAMKIGPFLVLAFVTHLATITGVYTGMVPAVPTPIPTPLPWAVLV